MSIFSVIITFIILLICIIYGASILNVPTDDSPVGPCLDGMCMEGYECKNDQCYPISSSTNTTTITNFTSEVIGPCVNGDCPDGFVCKEDSCYLQ